MLIRLFVCSVPHKTGMNNAGMNKTDADHGALRDSVSVSFLSQYVSKTPYGFALPEHTRVVLESTGPARLAGQNRLVGCHDKLCARSLATDA